MNNLKCFTENWTVELRYIKQYIHEPWDSAVGIKTDCGTGHRGVWVRVPVGYKFWVHAVS
jgi:hypothetical protein